MPRARKPQRIVVAGASGLIGVELVRQLREQGDEVVRLVRGTPSAPDEVNWAPASGVLDDGVLDGTDAVVNLAGASIGRIPWTPKYRRTLVESRIGPTRLLAEAMGRVANPPKAFLSASAVGFYGDRPGVRLTEDSEPGKGFLPRLVEDWEAAARLAPWRTRVVHLRTAVVVAPKGGGLGPVKTLTSFGLGARFGSGGQVWPWISLYDEAAAIRHLLRSRLRGAVNLAGPTPATSDRITHDYARLMRRPYLFVVPEAFVRLLGEAGQRLLLDSATVLPVKLEADGFRWRDETVDSAIAAALAKGD